MKNKILLLMLVGSVVQAAEISVLQAKRAVGNWLASKSALGCPMGRTVASARTCATTNGAVFHVVKLSGGGFVVTSADTKIEPVIAFSESEDLVEDARNPLWTLLTQDLAARAQALKTKRGVALTSAAPMPSTSSPAEEKWAKLLADGPTLMGVSSVSDVRVAPLVQSKWGQENNSIYSNWGDVCYNYYTPDHCVCGCVATAMAQIMRYHCFPDNTVTVAQQSFPCTLNGASKSYTLKGGRYDWGNMPLVPEDSSNVDWYAGGATEPERQAIGKLTYDCGVAMRMDYTLTKSGAVGAFAFSPLKEVFHFASARTLLHDLTSQRSIEKAIFANLDAGCPVIVGLNGHEVVADGYGYSAQTPYTHLNMGWCGMDDAWYALPIVETSQFYFSAIRSITYNIFPKRTGELLTGRVLTAQGAPIAGATVVAKDNGTTVGTATTDARGVYALVVTANRQYSVRAEASGQSASITASVGTSTDPSSINFSTSTSYGSTACGNSWGNDIALSGIQSVEPPVFNPGTCRFTSSVNVSLSCPTTGAVIHYTLDGTEPTESSAVYSAPFAVSETTTFKARAFKAGANPSPVVTATYTFTPPHDMFSDAKEIRHANGASTISSIGCSREEGEPDHSSIYYGAGVSVWWKWTAPGSGNVTLEASGDDGHYYINPLLAVYTGTDVAHLTLVGESANYTGNQQHISSLTFSASAGTTYFIAVDGTSATVLGDITLAWTSTIAEPSNDAFANAWVITGMSGEDCGCNAGFSKENGEPTHSSDGYTGGASAWWKWTAPSSGNYTFTAKGGDTQLAIYTSSSPSPSNLSGLELVCSNDDVSRSDITSCAAFTAVGGTTYYIAVDSYQGQTIPIVLAWMCGVMDSVSVAKEINALPVGGTSRTIEVEATGPWTATANRGWIQLGADAGGGNGILSYSVSSNATGALRTGTITVKCGGATATIDLYQGTLPWYFDRDEARVAAETDRKRILLFNGRETCPNCTSVRHYACEAEAVKAILLSSYVLWFNDCDEQWGSIVSAWTSGLGSYKLPLLCILDAQDMGHYVARTTGYKTAQELLEWLQENTPTSTLTSRDVPYSWLDAQFPASGTRTAAQYEALQDADGDGDGFANWQEYLCGTNPTRADSLPQCFITMNGSLPVVTHNVVVPSEAAALGWSAVLKGAATLSDWTAANPAMHRFFKVVVERR